VARDIASRIAQRERAIIRLSMESFLVDGRQDLVDPSRLV
jgi:3-deoxy-D-arabino-heptulosonate 7-phosphate (DAHP) synthase